MPKCSPDFYAVPLDSWKYGKAIFSVRIALSRILTLTATLSLTKTLKIVMEAV